MTETRGRSPEAILDEAAERLAEILVAQWEQQHAVRTVSSAAGTEMERDSLASDHLLPRR